MSSVSVDEVLRQELLEVEAARDLRLGEDGQRPAAQKSLIGLAFSGGGIRSATFNLGVLQALSRTRLLHFFDYVSTVSGGGYIGSWLMAWMYHEKIGVKEIETRLSPEKYSTASAADSHEVHFLRNYSNYLTPRKGLLGADFWAFVATYIRNTILNQIILVLLLLSVLLLPRTLVYVPNRLEAFENLTHHAFPAQNTAFVLAVCLVSCAVVFMGLNLPWVDPHTTRKFPWYAKQWGIQLVVVIPLIVAAALVSYSISYFMDADLFDEPLWQVPLLTTIHYVLFWAAAFLIRAGIHGKRGIKTTTGPSVLLVIVTAAVTGVLIGYLLLPFGKFLIPPPAPLDDYFNWHIFAFGTPVFVLIMLMAGTLHIGLMGRGMSDGQREWWARLGGWLVIYSMCWLLLFLMAIYVPRFLAQVWATHFPKFTAGALFWAVSTAYGVLFGKNKDTGERNPAAPISKKLLGYAARLTPYIFILGLFAALSLLAAKIALIFTNDPTPLDHLPRAFSGPAVLLACIVLLVAAFLLSWRVNINEFSIHHAYRNRLARCYLGASVPCRSAQPFTGFSEADDLPLTNLQIPLGSKDPKDGRPLPILNTSLNVVRGKELALQTRKARSFAFTPLFAGFTREATNRMEWQSAYAATKDSGSKHRGCENGISLGTTVAISGAAASPNMGSYSQPALAFLMTLFDVRLGWWIANPAVPKNWRVGGPRVGFFWLLRELLGSTDDDSGFVYLSDGGHFENLAVYELVRRGCKLIVAGDASCDPAAGFGDLHNAIERCRTDFGVEIVLDPSETMRQQNGLAINHYAVGRIHYSSSSADDGVIIYLKPTLVAGDPADVLGYNATNPNFPDDTTANQWFDETHFENYRALGEVSGFAAEDAIRQTLDRLMPQKETLIK